MSKKSVLSYIRKLNRRVFTTRELAAISNKSSSNTVQALNFLQKQNLVFKIYRGVWAEVTDKPLSPYSVISFLPVQSRCYLSFVSALHLYGIIEQIPQIITLASLEHTRRIYTEVGVFWYKKEGNFLIAEPEKALVDCLYISAYKTKQFSYFPELNFPKSFSFKKAKTWINKIPNNKARTHANKKLEKLIDSRKLQYINNC